MKVAIDVKDELVNRFGEEAIRMYLTKKAAKLETLFDRDADSVNGLETGPVDETDEETLKNAWVTFNKRGRSC